jgi:hypothetical protein
MWWWRDHEVAEFRLARIFLGRPHRSTIGDMPSSAGRIEGDEIGVSWRTIQRVVAAAGTW